jgi:hypothetical protein
MKSIRRKLSGDKEPASSGVVAAAAAALERQAAAGSSGPLGAGARGEPSLAPGAPGPDSSRRSLGGLRLSGSFRGMLGGKK